MSDARRASLEASSSRDRLIQGGLRAFSTRGFDGTSLREIERDVGVGRGLIAHHFGTKEELWRECINTLMGRFHDELTHVRENLADVSPHERARVLLKVYVRFVARNPDYTRIVALAGDEQSERVNWMVETWLRPNLRFFDRLAEQRRGADIDAAIGTYMFTGAASMVFTAPVEAMSTFGVDVTSDEFIERYADFLSDWVGFEADGESSVSSAFGRHLRQSRAPSRPSRTA